MKKVTAFREVEKAIADIKKEPRDKIGNTMLTLLADKIKLLSPDSKNRAAYVEAIQEFAWLREKISLRKIRNLCNLINMAELRKYEYLFVFAVNFQRRNWGILTRCNLAKRAEIFRLIGESKYKLFYTLISEEPEIKACYPWYWIDAVIHTDRQLAITETRKWLEENQNADPILMRLAVWKNLYRNKKSFRTMVSKITENVKLNKRQKETIKTFFESY